MTHLWKGCDEHSTVYRELIGTAWNKMHAGHRQQISRAWDGVLHHKEHKTGYNFIVISKEETLKAGEQNTKFIGFPKILSEIPHSLISWWSQWNVTDFSVSSHICFHFKANSLGFLLSDFVGIHMAMSLFCFINEEQRFFGANCSYIPPEDVCSFQPLVWLWLSQNWGSPNIFLGSLRLKLVFERDKTGSVCCFQSAFTPLVHKAWTVIYSTSKTICLLSFCAHYCFWIQSK